MPKAITINTVQGIGDIFWCYQKLAPYFDEININVMCLALVPLQMRSRDFCKMLPKVRRVEFVTVSHEKYQSVARGRFSLSDILFDDLKDDNRGPVDYAVNAALEHGVPLAEIDPGSELAGVVDLGLTRHVPQDEYLCAFVSGTRNALCWTPLEWIDVIAMLADQLQTRRVVLVGAKWDEAAQAVVGAGLTARHYRVANYTGMLCLADSMNLIRGARFFVGFQSGLGILADNFDVAQLMLYYRSLAAMSYTWCKPANARAVFNAATFDERPATILSRLPATMGGTIRPEATACD